MEALRVNIDILQNLASPLALNSFNIVYQTWLDHLSAGGRIVFEKVVDNTSETIQFIDTKESLDAFLGISE